MHRVKIKSSFIFALSFVSQTKIRHANQCSFIGRGAWCSHERIPVDRERFLEKFRLRRFLRLSFLNDGSGSVRAIWYDARRIVYYYILLIGSVRIAWRKIFAVRRRSSSFRDQTRRLQLICSIYGAIYSCYSTPRVLLTASNYF